jgi:hypothetical protein
LRAKRVAVDPSDAEIHSVVQADIKSTQKAKPKKQHICHFGYSLQFQCTVLKFQGLFTMAGINYIVTDPTQKGSKNYVKKFP